MKETKKKKLDKFLKEMQEEKRHLGSYYEKYNSIRLIKETRSLKNATWFMAFATFTLVIFSLFEDNLKQTVLGFVVKLLYLIAIALGIPIFIGIIWGIIKNLINKNKK